MLTPLMYTMYIKYHLSHVKNSAGIYAPYTISRTLDYDVIIVFQRIRCARNCLVPNIIRQNTARLNTLSHHLRIEVSSIAKGAFYTRHYPILVLYTPPFSPKIRFCTQF